MRTHTVDMVTFATARLDEDEQACLDARPDRRYHDPEWGLALVEVLRTSLASVQVVDPPPPRLRALVAVWTDHPDFRPEWKSPPGGLKSRRVPPPGHLRVAT